MNTIALLAPLFIALNFVYIIENQIFYRHLKKQHKDEWENLGSPDVLSNNTAGMVIRFLKELFSGRLDKIEGLEISQIRRLTRLRVMFVVSLAFFLLATAYILIKTFFR